MTAYRYTEIACDAPNCDRARSDRGNAYDVRQAAAGENWTVGSKGDFCPDHRTRASRMLIADTEGRTA